MIGWVRPRSRPSVSRPWGWFGFGQTGYWIESVEGADLFFSYSIHHDAAEDVTGVLCGLRAGRRGETAAKVGCIRISMHVRSIECTYSNVPGTRMPRR